MLRKILGTQQSSIPVNRELYSVSPRFVVVAQNLHCEAILF